MNLDTDLTLYTRTNSKSTIDLNVKYKTITSLRKHKKNLYDFRFGGKF